MPESVNYRRICLTGLCEVKHAKWQMCDCDSRSRADFSFLMFAHVGRRRRLLSDGSPSLFLVLQAFNGMCDIASSPVCK